MPMPAMPPNTPPDPASQAAYAAATERISGLFATVLSGSMRNFVTHAFEACRIPACTRRSLGFVCTRCSKTLCNSHTYLSLTAPPQPVCSLCISQELEGEQADARAEQEQDRPRRKGKRSARAATEQEPQEVHAEVVDDDPPRSSRGQK